MSTLAPTRLLSTIEAAARLGVHPDTLRRWREKGALRSVQAYRKGRVRYHEEDIQAILEGSQHGRNGERSP